MDAPGGQIGIQLSRAPCVEWLTVTRIRGQIEHNGAPDDAQDARNGPA